MSPSCPPVQGGGPADRVLAQYVVVMTHQVHPFGGGCDVGGVAVDAVAPQRFGRAARPVGIDHAARSAGGGEERGAVGGPQGHAVNGAADVGLPGGRLTGPAVQDEEPALVAEVEEVTDHDEAAVVRDGQVPDEAAVAVLGRDAGLALVAATGVGRRDEARPQRPGGGVESGDTRPVVVPDLGEVAADL